MPNNLFLIPNWVDSEYIFKMPLQNTIVSKSTAHRIVTTISYQCIVVLFCTKSIIKTNKSNKELTKNTVNNSQPVATLLSFFVGLLFILGILPIVAPTNI